MPYELRNTLAALLCNLGVNSYMVWKLMNLHATGALDGPDALSIFGKTVLWVIPISIIATVVMCIASNILVAIIRRDPKPDFIADERDQMFKTRSNSVVLIFAAAGFIGAMIALAMGWTPIPVFTLIYFSFALGDLAGTVVKGMSYAAGG
jgi:hypothetical protein